MSAMPLARIYASQVEEAEPLRADLFARGYNVEVVFPDAELTGPADLELRLEHCSPAQAIARVEADSGSPSRCVFLTSTKSPQRDLLLIEMTVAATGTYSRHPLYVPVHLPGTTLVSIPKIEKQAEAQDMHSLAAVLPFPKTNSSASSDPTPSPSVDHGASDSRVSKSDDDWDKLVGAEVTAFLAHAPSVEPATFPLVAICGDLQARAVKQVRSRWEILSVMGVAASVLLLVYVGWNAGTSRPWPATVRVVHAAPSAIPVASVAQSPEVPALSPVSKPTISASRIQPHARWGEGLIARDTVQQVGRHFRKASISQPFALSVASKNQPLTVAAVTAKPVQTIRTQASPVPVKKITDLR